MRAVWIGLAGALALGCSEAGAESQPTPLTTVYLVRHAEKVVGEGATADPPLTEAGVERAARLGAMLVDVELTGVYSTDTERTRATAAPTARGHALEVQPYSSSSELASTLKDQGGHYLVVGHSNTVPGLVRAFGGEPGEPIGDTEYDRLYVVVAGDQVSTSLLRYGATSTR